MGDSEFVCQYKERDFCLTIYKNARVCCSVQDSASLFNKGKLTVKSDNTGKKGVRNNPIQLQSESTAPHKNGFLRRGELGELYVRYDSPPYINN